VARNVWFYIGMPKTGTSYLQSILWANKANLREQGLLLPLNGHVDHYWAWQALRGKVPVTAPPRRRSTWDRLTRAVGRWDGDVLVSHEGFARTDGPKAAAALSALSQVSESVHLVLTVRDLARQLPSVWQQSVKAGLAFTFDDFMERLDDAPARWYGRDQDLRRVLRRWQRGLPSERIHLVTVPPSGSSHDLLLHRMAGALQVSVADLDSSSARRNRSLGRAEIELMRRSNDASHRSELPKRLQRMLTRVLGNQVLATSGSEPLIMAPSHLDWARARSAEIVTSLRGGGYTIHGDLNDLLVPEVAADGRRPPYVGDPVEEAELVDVAVRVLEHAVIAGYRAGRKRGTRGSDR
jgi:hypothetical protein